MKFIMHLFFVSIFTNINRAFVIEHTVHGDICPTNVLQLKKSATEPLKVVLWYLYSLMPFINQDFFFQPLLQHNSFVILFVLIESISIANSFIFYTSNNFITSSILKSLGAVLLFKLNEQIHVMKVCLNKIYFFGYCDELQW